MCMACLHDTHHWHPTDILHERIIWFCSSTFQMIKIIHSCSVCCWQQTYTHLLSLYCYRALTLKGCNIHWEDILILESLGTKCVWAFKQKCRRQKMHISTMMFWLCYLNRNLCIIMAKEASNTPLKSFSLMFP